ncbi:MAG: hypothetical protein LBD95_07475 [Clostridiales Family XIII bacterium]|jgi:hypothetical protein|nr:hypothetical protein [Clostridiales Family XIII bacterium]
MGRGGAGGGGFGGGRSFGGGGFGGRSFGHVSGSRGRGGSGGGRGAGGGFSGGGFGGGPFIFLGGAGGGRSHGSGYGTGNRRPGGCSTGFFVVCVLLILIVAAVLLLRYASVAAAPASTYQRTPLPEGLALETAYLKDDAHWIGNVGEVERAMRHFRDKTGVFPYLWIADSVDGGTAISDEEAEAALNALYDAEIADEGHIVILFFEPYSGVYDIYYIVGAAARTVLDREACDILMHYFERYYYGDYDDEGYFAKVFTDAADRIMSKTVPTSRILLFAAVGLIALIVVCLFVVTMVKRTNERKRLNAEILNTPIDESDAFKTEDEADRAAKKYDF